MKTIKKTGHILPPALLLFCILCMAPGPRTVSSEDDPAGLILHSMTFEQKIGQLAVLFPAENDVPYDAIRDSCVGGVFLGEPHVEYDPPPEPRKGEFASYLPAQNRHDAIHTEAYSAGRVVKILHETVQKLQDNAPVVEANGRSYRIPLFIAGDFEGGMFPSLAWRIADVPSMMAITQTGDFDAAFDAGSIIGREMEALGFNMNFGPVAEPVTDTSKDMMGVRSAGQDPELVAGVVVSFFKGIKEGNVIVVAKHFPGHGSANVNPHFYVPVTDYPLWAIDRDARPFVALHKNRVDGFMTAHVCFTRLNPGGSNMPLTIDPKSLSILVKKYGMANELWITDELFYMKATRKAIGGKSAPHGVYYEIAYKALEAGHDMLLFRDQSHLDEALDAMKDFFAKYPERLDRSVRKVLTAKMKLYPSFRFAMPSGNEALKVIASNTDRAHEIARRSIVLARDDLSLFANNSGPLNPAKGGEYRIVVLAPSNGIYATNLAESLRRRNRGYKIEDCYFPLKAGQFKSEHVSRELADSPQGNLYNILRKALSEKSGAEKTILLIAFARPREGLFAGRLYRKLCDKVFGKNMPPTIFVALDEPYLLPMKELGALKLSLIAASSRNSSSIEAVIDVLEGKFAPGGPERLTVKVK